MAEGKCGLGCKLAKAVKKIKPGAERAYKKAGEVYTEYKETRDRYEEESRAPRREHVSQSPRRSQKVEYAQEEKVVYVVPIKKKQSLGSKLYHMGERAYQNLQENAPETFSVYGPPRSSYRRPAGTTRARTSYYYDIPDDDDYYVPSRRKTTTRAPARTRVVREVIDEDDYEYVSIRRPVKRKTTSPRAPAGYRLVKTTTAKRKSTKRKTTRPKAPAGYRLVKTTTAKRKTAKPKTTRYVYVRRM